MRTVLLAAALGSAAAAADDPKLPDGPKGFQGTWTIVKLVHGGADTVDPTTARTVVFTGTTYEIKFGNRSVEQGTFRADATTTPNRIDVTATTGEDKGTRWHGIYELEGGTLRAVVGPTDKARPESLNTVPPGARGFTLKRAAPAKK
jgi:uncharacterized protein (TIGR03067 family)